MPVRRRLLVTGRVQGVFYRDSCQRQAEGLGVSGWVHNVADGNVEIEAEGDEAAVTALERWAAIGPRRAEVESVTASELDPVGSSSFVIR